MAYQARKLEDINTTADADFAKISSSVVNAGDPWAESRRLLLARDNPWPVTSDQGCAGPVAHINRGAPLPRTCATFARETVGACKNIN